MNNANRERCQSKQAAADCLVAFGSNEGNSNRIYRDVHNRLAEIASGEVIASQPIVTAAVGGPQQNDYLNGVFRFSTELSPTHLHRVLVDLESEFGRQRRQRWGPRRIDLDLLLYGEQVYSDAALQIPHPRMSFRRFVLEPASQIAAEMKHPSSELTIGELLSRINQKQDELLWITSQFELAGQLIEELKVAFPDWSFHLVDRQELVLDDINAALPKLIVSDFKSPDFRWQAASLNLTGCNREDIMVEIQAALKAMEPTARA